MQVNPDIQAKMNELKNVKDEFAKKVTGANRDEIAERKDELIKMIKEW